MQIWITCCLLLLFLERNSWRRAPALLLRMSESRMADYGELGGYCIERPSRTPSRIVPGATTTNVRSTKQESDESVTLYVAATVHVEHSSLYCRWPEKRKSFFCARWPVQQALFFSVRDSIGIQDWNPFAIQNLIVKSAGTEQGRNVRRKWKHNTKIRIKKHALDSSSHSSSIARGNAIWVWLFNYRRLIIIHDLPRKETHARKAVRALISRTMI